MIMELRLFFLILTKQTTDCYSFLAFFSSYEYYVKKTDGVMRVHCAIASDAKKTF